MTAEQMKYEFEVGYDKITNFDAPGYEPKEISTFLTRAQENVVYEIFKSSANKEGNKKSVSELRQVLPLRTFAAGNYPNGYISLLRNYFSGAGIFSFTANTIVDSGAGFLGSNIRIGDILTIRSSTTNNNRTVHIINVTASTLTISSQDAVLLVGSGGTAAYLETFPVLRVRNERADIEVTSDNFYYGKITNNEIDDVEVNPIDEDFYHANKKNPFKKPNEKRLWRIDYSNENQRVHEYITDGTYTIDEVHLHIDRKLRPIIVPDANYVAADATIDDVYFIDFVTGLDCEIDKLIHRSIVDKAVKMAYAALQDQTGFQISSVQEQQEQQQK
jgi:hypothetical protein